jgi:hypothetical protein
MKGRGLFGPSIYTPASPEIITDPDGLDSIVFVHGLGGHPVKTWSMKDVYWPKDLLGPGVPNVRILAVGYDAYAAKAFERVTQNNLHDHAQACMSYIHTSCLGC